MKTIRYGNEFWKMHDDGCITRPGIFDKPSGQWRVTGAVRLNNFGYAVEFFTLDDIKRGGIQWKHKNGAQRVFIRDFDHGSRRQWTNKHEVI
jgi:hypothetical protein